MKKYLSTLLYFILGFSFVFFTGLSKIYAKNKKTPPPPIESLEVNPLEKVKAFSNLTADFYDFVLRYNGRLIPGKALQPWIAKIESATQAYFASIGVQYKTQVVKRENLEFQGSYIDKMSYRLFIPTEALEPTEMNGLFFFQTLNDDRFSDLQLTFDPFLPLWSGPIQGFFEPATNSLYFSVTALSYRTGGLGDTLQHELRHALEHRQLLEGKDTLASFTLMSTQSTSEVYSDFLRLDEIETHLLDIAYLKEEAPLLENNVLEKSSLKRLREERNRNLEFKKETVLRLLKNSFSYLTKLKMQIGSLQCQTDTEPILRVCTTDKVIGETYDRIEIRFTNNQQTDTQKVSALIDWALKKISSYQLIHSEGLR
ncbi:MAG: hypothetical protein OM95_11815 [Bdellovibrio sp. ArHS]|uniref:hypothetical protein n=1 Tax=Bdellovibrio sp. ArHS TaxID=1569284 RepID=UPI000582B1C8|nr:hypothetical protein [Bdellovibrio sp. ArHS]KHD87945.1 MAG: hypothetical protein OM95_11815 [Bdellovibrio sp. ArHS]